MCWGLVLKIINSPGDVTDTSAKTATLVLRYVVSRTLTLLGRISIAQCHANFLSIATWPYFCDCDWMQFCRTLAGGILLGAPNITV